MSVQRIGRKLRLAMLRLLDKKYTQYTNPSPTHYEKCILAIQNTQRAYCSKRVLQGGFACTLTIN